MLGPIRLRVNGRSGRKRPGGGNAVWKHLRSPRSRLPSEIELRACVNQTRCTLETSRRSFDCARRATTCVCMRPCSCMSLRRRRGTSEHLRKRRCVTCSSTALETDLEVFMVRRQCLIACPQPMRCHRRVKPVTVPDTRGYNSRRLFSRAHFRSQRTTEQG
jgi:hypothetical protein